MMAKTQDVAALGYPFRVVPEDGAYFIEVPDLPGCITAADTADEIVPMVTEAVRGWIHAAEELGRPVPGPGGVGSAYTGAVQAEREQTGSKPRSRRVKVS
jgi:predicted RNase H-like HicB family nuclease